MTHKRAYPDLTRPDPFGQQKVPLPEHRGYDILPTVQDDEGNYFTRASLNELLHDHEVAMKRYKFERRRI